MKRPACSRVSPTAAIQNPAPERCSTSLGQRQYRTGCTQSASLRERLQALPRFRPHRIASVPSQRHREARSILQRGPSARPHSDGHWLGQDLRRHQLRSTGCSNTLTPNAFSFSSIPRHLGEQAEQECMAYVPSDDNRKFTELYNVQRLKSSLRRQGQPSLHQHHPAHVFAAEGRGVGRIRRRNQSGGNG